MIRDALYIEMMGSDDPISGRHSYPPESPIDDPLFDFQRSTGAGELRAAQLEARHLAEGLLGPDDLLKRLREGLIDLTPNASFAPIDTNSFVQEPLPTPDEADVRLCDCSCKPCRKDDCEHCEAEKKCSRHPSHATEAHKVAIARIVGEFRGRLYPARVQTEQLERAMVRYVQSVRQNASHSL